MAPVALPFMAGAWRRLDFGEFFRYNYMSESSAAALGLEIGYAVEVGVLLNRHSGCGCIRCRIPEQLVFVRKHDAHCGSFPVHFLVEEFYLHEIKEWFASSAFREGIGRVVTAPLISCGYVRHWPQNTSSAKMVL